MTIAPFGWVDHSQPYITAANLEAMLAEAGAYADALVAGGTGLPPGSVQYESIMWDGAAWVQDASAGGGIPKVFRVNDPVFGGKGGGHATSATDTAAVTAAIGAALAATSTPDGSYSYRSGLVYFEGVYEVGQPPTQHWNALALFRQTGPTSFQSQNLTLMGASNASGKTRSRAALIYTGSGPAGSSFLDARGANQLKIVGLQVLYTNPAFFGDVVNIDGLGATRLTQPFNVNGDGTCDGTMFVADASTFTGQTSIAFTGDTTDGSPVIANIDDTSLMGAGDVIAGPGVVSGSTILKVIDPNTIQLNQNIVDSSGGQVGGSFTDTQASGAAKYVNLKQGNQDGTLTSVKVVYTAIVFDTTNGWHLTGCTPASVSTSTVNGAGQALGVAQPNALILHSTSGFPNATEAITVAGVTGSGAANSGTYTTRSPDTNTLSGIAGLTGTPADGALVQLWPTAYLFPAGAFATELSLSNAQVGITLEDSYIGSNAALLGAGNIASANSCVRLNSVTTAVLRGVHLEGSRAGLIAGDPGFCNQLSIEGRSLLRGNVDAHIKIRASIQSLALRDTTIEPCAGGHLTTVLCEPWASFGGLTLGPDLWVGDGTFPTPFVIVGQGGGNALTIFGNAPVATAGGASSRGAYTAGQTTLGVDPSSIKIFSANGGTAMIRPATYTDPLQAVVFNYAGVDVSNSSAPFLTGVTQIAPTAVTETSNASQTITPGGNVNVKTTLGFAAGGGQINTPLGTATYATCSGSQFQNVTGITGTLPASTPISLAVTGLSLSFGSSAQIMPAVPIVYANGPINGLSMFGNSLGQCGYLVAGPGQLSGVTIAGNNASNVFELGPAVNTYHTILIQGAGQQPALSGTLNVLAIPLDVPSSGHLTAPGCTGVGTYTGINAARTQFTGVSGLTGTAKANYPVYTGAGPTSPTGTTSLPVAPFLLWNPPANGTVGPNSFGSTNTAPHPTYSSSPANRQVVNSLAYRIPLGADLVAIPTGLGGAPTVGLPKSATMPVGKVMWIVDEGQTAGAATVTIASYSTATFADGSSSKTFTTSGFAAGVYFDGTHWQLITGPQGPTGATGSPGPPGPAPTTVTILPQGGSYTALAADAGKLIQFTAAATYTINTSVFAGGEVIELVQYAAGQVTIAAGAGITLHSPGAKVATRTQYSTVAIVMIDATNALLTGDLG